jgi:class 3 adenylate cyclase/tetratricopeptide (TPR) repeat protein
VNCASCGAENREEARYCDVCGAVLTAQPVREQRKVVTVLFCDVTGSTALGESLDPEALRAVMARYFDVARVAIERHGGTLEKFIGDAVMAVFGVPTVREDDALRAVRAAQELRDAVEIAVRIGVNTGEVVTGSGDSLVTGDAVNVAARLEQAASPGEVLLGAGTYALVRDAVDVELLPPIEAKGKSEPVTAYRLGSVTGDAAYNRRVDSHLVGREREGRLLADAWSRAISEEASALFTILGNAGVGKSRLAAEFVKGLDATVVRGACLSYGEGITYWPVVEVVKQLLGASPPPDQAIAALLGDGQATADDIAFAVRKLFESAAVLRPLVVVFDDVHWAEPTFLDLIEHVADWSRGAPILLLCLARPELLEVRSSWGGGKLNATTVLLESLSAAETDELIDSLLGGGDLDPTLRDRIRTAADGNPLFVEQMLAMVEESPDDVTVPATIQALLSARLDQLPADERAALERGAVEGQVFHRGAVAALAPEDGNVTSHLFGLVRKELVRPSVATLPGDDAFRFRHLLIRDAAYDALPKAARAGLHERFAEWIEQQAPELVELDEILGYHLEQAALYRAELGLPASELALRAAGRLHSAGRRAARREDVGAGIRLLTRALALSAADELLRDEVKLELGRALYATGEMQRAADLLREAAAARDRELSARASFLLTMIECHMGGALFEEGERQVSEQLDNLETEDAGATALAEGYLAYAGLLFWNGRTSELVDAARKALAHAVRAGDTMLEVDARTKIGVGMFYGPAQWAEVEAHARASLGEADRLGPSVLGARQGLAGALVAQGRFDEARGLYREHHEYLEERGQSFSLLSSRQHLAVCELLAGDFERAEEHGRLAWDGLGLLGERGYRSTTGGILAEALAELGRLDEAAAIIDESEEIAGEDDWLTTAQCTWARALVALHSGDDDRAIKLACRATEVADTRDYINTRTHYWWGLARVLVAAGRDVEAREAMAETQRLAALKGSVVYEGRIRDLAGQLDQLDPTR